MKKIVSLLAVGISLFSLAACNEQPSSGSSNQEPILVTKEDDGTATIKIYRDSNSQLDECYIAPRNVNMTIDYQALSGLLSNNQTVCPSEGDVKLLVIPVHIPGSTYNTEEVRKDIETTFFGKEGDTRLGYPSLSTYYETSSYGKLHFSGEVTDWFDVAEHTSITDASQITTGINGTIINEILHNAVEWAVEDQGVNLTDYDYDKDGFIDGIWLVYDQLDFTTENKLNPGATLNQSFWNMTSWDYESYKSEEFINKQVEWGAATSGFSWASFDMMYTPYCEYDSNEIPILDDLSSIELSSHTFIHETGHLLGLEDLYATDSQTYRPAGQYTMMDQNVGDLDTMSKMLLGWVTPYVVYGGSEILLQDTSVNDHQAIVIPSNYNEINEQVKLQTEQGFKPDEIKINFNPFSEYILIDLYAPTGNNAFDAGDKIIYGRNKGVEETGVRIYHVDNRIFKCNVTSTGTLVFNVDDYIWNGEQLSSKQAIFTAITNSVETGSIDVNSYVGNKLGIDFNTFDQLRLIEATGRNTFSYGYGFTNSTLWKEDTKPFSIYDFGLQFFQGTNSTYNDGTKLPFYIDVTSLKEVTNA